MNTEKEIKKTMFDPLYSTKEEVNCATGIASNALEDWREGGKPCPKCGSFYTQKNIAMCLTTYPCQYPFRCMNCSHTWTDHEWYDGGLSYQPQPKSPNPLREYGWICPKCGGVFAPHMNYCTNCTQPRMPKITCIDLGGSITGTALGTTSVVNECNTVMTNANTNSAPKIRKGVPRDDNKSNT